MFVCVCVTVEFTSAIPYFFDQTPQLLFISLFVLCDCILFEGGIYFFGKPADIASFPGSLGIRYRRVRRWRLLDTVSSARSPSVMLLAMEMTHTTRIALALAWWPSSESIRTHVCMLHILAAATIRGRQLFEGSDYSRAASIRYFVACVNFSLLRPLTGKSLHCA